MRHHARAVHPATVSSFARGLSSRWATVGLILALAIGGSVTAQTVLPPDFSPVSGDAAVIAQGVADLSADEVVWRTSRARVGTPEDEPFEPRPLGFVVAADGPLLLTNQDTGERIRLGPGEASFVQAGTIQQRASLTDTNVSFLAIDLVPASEANNAGAATLLQSGQPFSPSPGAHDLDLVRDVVTSDASFVMPDTGEKNAILITSGAVSIGRPGTGSATLLAGEAATFNGEIEVRSSDANESSFVIATIGALLPASSGAASTAGTMATPPITAPAATQVATTEPAATEPPAASGSIAVRVWNCPDPMTPTSFDPSACAPAETDFDLTLSSDSLPTTLTTSDATSSESGLTWDDLPTGDYVLAEAVLPVGFTTYVVVGPPGLSGSATTGYRLTLDEQTPDVTVDIFNFTAS